MNPYIETTVYLDCEMLPYVWLEGCDAGIGLSKSGMDYRKRLDALVEIGWPHKIERCNFRSFQCKIDTIRRVAKEDGLTLEWLDRPDCPIKIQSDRVQAQWREALTENHKEACAQA